ncbi:homeobox protein ESX1-like [Zingiber officinale]|uniref:homeobox protein ESX1-like n=1 Tax=Zingiber officinale TaxID=94328 RepID=UPI001C4A95A7|nr:homeobox protein ESX1-like [Zingiber officinale]
MAPLDVPTSAVRTVSTPTVFTVQLGVLPAYPTLAPAQPTAYPAPQPPGPTVYPTPVAPVPPLPTLYPAVPAPAIPVAPHPVPLPTVHPAATTYVDPTVPPMAYAPVYAAALGVPLLVYPAVPPIASVPVFPPVQATVLTHLIGIIAARARIPALAESMKS